MATKTLNISIPQELADFLDLNKELSPSKMFQSKCYEVKEQRKDFERLLKVKDNIIKNLMNFITEKNLLEEFNKWKLQ